MFAYLKSLQNLLQETEQEQVGITDKEDLGVDLFNETSLTIYFGFSNTLWQRERGEREGERERE